MSKAIIQVMTLAAMANGFNVNIGEKKKPTYKNCMNCGKEHTHNNTCCSAECFKELNAS